VTEVVKLYKITSGKNTTPAKKKYRKAKQITWKAGQWHSVPRGKVRWRGKDVRGRQLCTNTVIHAFETVDQVIDFFDKHPTIFNRRSVLWEAEGRIARDPDGNLINDGQKVGCTSLRVIKRVRPNPLRR